MAVEPINYRISGASKVLMFLIFTVVGALITIMIIQPMGPVLGIGTIAIFLALWAWFLFKIIREMLNRPKSIAFDDDGITYATRKNTFRIPWGTVENVLEMNAPTGPRGSSIRRLTLFAKDAPEIWFSEFMLHARGTGTPPENYAAAKDCIIRHVTGEKVRAL
ncbi:MAG TPA: hypothetical protein PKY31_16200 [Spirochaetota bacterium]|nr:hypothetical protein [Spirochaetota bacterium]